MAFSGAHCQHYFPGPNSLSTLLVTGFSNEVKLKINGILPLLKFTADLSLP